MQLPGLCRDCGRTIAKDYVYCPWCGVSQVTGELVAVGAARGRSAAHAGAGNCQYSQSSRLKSITQRLNELENEFTVFAMRRDQNDDCQNDY